MDQYKRRDDDPIARSVAIKEPDSNTALLEEQLRIVRSELATLKRKLLRSQQDIEALSSRINKR